MKYLVSIEKTMSVDTNKEKQDLKKVVEFNLWSFVDWVELENHPASRITKELFIWDDIGLESQMQSLYHIPPIR